VLVPVQGIVKEFLSAFKEYPPRAKAASFTVNQALEKPQDAFGYLSIESERSQWFLPWLVLVIGRECYH
jgi:hypothetical protein